MLSGSNVICEERLIYVNSEFHQRPKSGLPRNLTTSMELNITAVLFANG